LEEKPNGEDSNLQLIAVPHVGATVHAVLYDPARLGELPHSGLYRRVRAGYHEYERCKRTGGDSKRRMGKEGKIPRSGLEL